MKSADHVEQKLKKWKEQQKPLMWIAWQVALLCVGWAYVFAAAGQLCTPAKRKYFFASKGDDHPTIKSKCQVIRDKDPKPDCTGCKWYPGGKMTRIFDCRGFTFWILYIVYGWSMKGAGATSQWNTKSNWKAQGTIDTCPDDQLVVLFEYNTKKKNMKHTGLGYGNETIECQVGVQHSTKRSSKWTHWALPACCAEDYVPPAEKPKEDKVSKPTLKKGSSGKNVKELQTALIKRGFSCGSKGADGKFGNDTLAAVKAFQKANGLKVTGVVDAGTWEALEKAPADERYTVTITGLDKKTAQEVCEKYKNATMKVEN